MRERRSRLKLRSPLAIVAALGVAVFLAADQRRVNPIPLAGSGSGDSTCWDYKPAERGFASNMNSVRLAAGRTRLRLDPELSKSARKHTAEMVGRQTLYHTPTSVLKRRVTNWSTLGENVGVGATVDSLHSAFMGSTAHKENILYSSFRYVGIGVREADGRMWVTVIFEAASNPGTRLRMPSC